MTFRARRYLVAILVCVPQSALYAQSPSANHIWTTIGASGVPDESSTGRYKFGSSGSVYLSSAASNAVLRYNVTGLPPIGTSNASIVQVRLKDNGGAARVIVRLHEQHSWTGQLRTLLAFDSNTCLASASADYRVCAAAYGGDEDLGQERFPEWDFDFANRSYFFEVQLIRTSAGGDPALQAIRICHKFECANRW